MGHMILRCPECGTETRYCHKHRREGLGLNELSEALDIPYTTIQQRIKRQEAEFGYVRLDWKWVIEKKPRQCVYPGLKDSCADAGILTHTQYVAVRDWIGKRRKRGVETTNRDGIDHYLERLDRIANEPPPIREPEGSAVAALFNSLAPPAGIDRAG